MRKIVLAVLFLMLSGSVMAWDGQVVANSRSVRDLVREQEERNYYYRQQQYNQQQAQYEREQAVALQQINQNSQSRNSNPFNNW